ncbi:MAG: dihydrofolate reductase [Deltaproteobacteria bacterium HGW-Deltaproteobacteria-23]|nr:MAG: dihydrofolate reductase [Deltaproteobacteria bacterium HGW-Deltaproteobacteria-23]
MMVSIIVAMSRNGIIGRDKAIPWNIPADMSRFRELTLGHTLIMGRKTFESIGRPLPGRRSIVVSRQADYSAAGVLVAASLREALLLAGDRDEVFICGGGEIYQQALPFAARIYLTLIDCEIDGDTGFPLLQLHDFVETSRERIAQLPPADFLVLERKPPAGEVPP